jgi:hypothetical protein
MHTIDLSRTLFIQPTWSPNPARLKEDPPFQLRGDTDAMTEHDIEMEGLINQGEIKQARRYDYYRDIIHISLMIPRPGNIRGPATHMIVAPGAAEKYHDEHQVLQHTTGTLRRDVIKPSRIHFFEDEASMLTTFWSYLAPTCGLNCVAGWNIIHGVWPQLVGKALQYRLPVPDHFRADPLRRYQDTNVLAVDTIYTQGVYFKARPLPQLADLIEWWALPTEDTLPPLSRKQIAELTPDQWLDYGCRAVEKQLHGMIDITEYYYGEGTWGPTVSLAEDRLARGPRPTQDSAH